MSKTVDQSGRQVELKFCELLMRDGIQGWPVVLSTDEKLQLLHAIDQSGVNEIDVTSFVPPHIVPQFADATTVLEGFKGKAEIRVLAGNLKGVERAIAVHQDIRPITTCGMPISASESHNLANLRCDHATHKERINTMVAALLNAGIKPMVCVATAWGCPIEGEVSQNKVLELVSWLRSIGVTTIMLGDTTGMANPATAFNLFNRLTSSYDDLEFIAHFHDNRGSGIANVLAAINAGVTRIDGCLGGLGGEPTSVEQGDVGMSGNVVSEDLIGLLNEMGYASGVQLDALLSAGSLAEKIIKRPLFSKWQRLSTVN